MIKLINKLKKFAENGIFQNISGTPMGPMKIREFERREEEILVGMRNIAGDRNEDETSALRGIRLKLQTEANTRTRQKEDAVADLVLVRLSHIEQYKKNGILPEKLAKEARELYLVLSELGGRMNGRYVKMPKEWTKFGIHAGVLEDLIVVLRTPSYIGLGSKHIYSFTELYDGFTAFLEREAAEGKIQPRFMFLSNLVITKKNTFEAYLRYAISNQGGSKRIGVYEDNIYAIQGIVDVQFDDRVTTVMTLDNCPPYAVHFTKADLAMSIWTSKQTSSVKPRANGKPITPGSICRFARPIHALTNVVYSGGRYRIRLVDKDIRDRMAHGIKDDHERPKYQAGLAIDVRRLVEILPPGSVRTNEIGTLLVDEDIPKSCLLYCIHSSADVESFWAGV